MRFLRLLASLALATLAALPALAQDIGTIRFAAGTVEVVRGAERIPAARGTAVRQGDSVVTGAASTAQLVMVDNALISMRAGTTLSLERYQFDTAGTGAGEALIALVRGTMRTFTGLIVARDRDKFRMRTSIATLGIRGSGNILAHDDGIGTVNHTLTGAHSVTGKDPSGAERTLVSYPGQTIQVLPGQAPRFIPTPPFILAAASQGGKAAAKEEKTATTAGTSPEDGSATNAAGANGAGGAAVAAAQSTTSTLGGILVAVQPPPNSGYEALIRSSNPVPGGVEGVIGQTFALNGGGAVLDAAGRLVAIQEGSITGFLAGTGALPPGYAQTTVQPAGITFQGGTHTDGYRTPDGAVTIGRWEGGTVVVNGSPLYALGPRSVTYDVTVPTSPGVVGAFTGTTTYSLVAATRPTDSAGNVGAVSAATVGINFSSRVATGSFALGVNGQNFTLTGTSDLNVGGFYTFATGIGNLGIGCAGANCQTVGYQGTLNGRVAGSDGRWSTVTYRVNPRRLPGQPFSDMIVGSIVLGAPGAPTVGIVLPQTGTANLVFTGLTGTSFNNFGPPVNAQLEPTVATGTLAANFSARTVNFNLAVGHPGAGPTYTATVTGAPIVGVGFSASTTTGPNLGTATVTCSAPPCGAAGTGVGRFDGIFTTSAGNQGQVTFFLGDSLGAYGGTAGFGPAAGPIAPSAIALDARSATTALATGPSRATGPAAFPMDVAGPPGRRIR
jgi:hypothetical protein